MLVDLSAEVHPGIMYADGHYRWGSERRRFELKQWISMGNHYQTFIDAGSHVGTHVETTAEVERFLADSDLPLCVDTGHLLIGGTDPVELVRAHPDRVGHVHLKDVRADLAEAVRDGRTGYTEAVARGVYVPLGDGDVDLLELLKLLRDNDYAGWYVLEQDTALPEHDGPDDAGADLLPRRATARSLAFLQSVH